MKKLFVIQLFLITASHLYSQDWKFLMPEEKYHFQYLNNELPLSTILIDSLNIKGELTTYFLNRLVLPCDTCSENGFFLDNQPGFLQRSIIYSQVSSTVLLQNPETYEIHLPGNTEKEWWFDKKKSQKAKLDTIIEKEVFGVSDSVALISINNELQIELSKSYGLLKYFDYTLSGLKKANKGLCLPGHKEFYDFQVGDVFQYDVSTWNMQLPCTAKDIIKQTVKAINFSNDTITIEWKIQQFYWFENGCGSSDSMPGVNEYEYIEIVTDSDLCNAFPNEIKELYHGSYGIPHFELKDNDIQLQFNTNKDAPPYTGVIIKGEDGSYSSTENSIVYEIKHTYQIGLGNIHEYEDIRAESTYNKMLIGYVKNNDTTGTVYHDDFYVIDTTTIRIEQQAINLQQVNIYPNPSKGKITFDVGQINSDVLVKIYALNGTTVSEFEVDETISLNLDNLDSGVYIISMTSEIGTEHFRWVKN